MYPSNANNCWHSDIWLETGSQEEYGCHKARFNNGLREKICIYCEQRKPASLEELAFSAILTKAELLKRVDSALCHLPHRICWLIGRALNAKLFAQALQLVGIVSEYGETRPSWFDVDQSKSVFLSRFLLYCEAYPKLKPYMTSRSAGIDEIIQYLSNFDNTYQDFWSKMFSAITKLKAEADGEGLEPLKSIIGTDKNNVVLIKVTELQEIRLGYEYVSMKELQRLTKTFACPVVFKTTTIGLLNAESHEIPHLLDDIDPEVIVDVDIGKSSWSVEDIDALGRVLSACNNLSSIFIQQFHTFTEDREGFAPAVSRCLSQHHQLQIIGLTGFDLEGTAAMYPLPPVNYLDLCLCTLTEEDLNFMANRSDLALKTLTVNNFFFYDYSPSLHNFIQNQAKSLMTLQLSSRSMSPAEICKLLRNMTKSNMLQSLVLMCLEVIDSADIEKIVADLMAIPSTRACCIYNPSDADVSEIEAEANHLKDVVKELCRANRRPPISLELTRKRY